MKNEAFTAVINLKLSFCFSYYNSSKLLLQTIEIPYMHTFTPLDPIKGHDIAWIDK